jgi:heme exporter protein A
MTTTNLGRRFESRKVFEAISLDLGTGDSLAVVGPNGAGKSTLLQTLLGLLRPSTGSVRWMQDEAVMSPSEFGRHVGFVAPYVTLYDQLTAEENIKFFASVASTSVTGRQINDLLAMVGLEGRGQDCVGEYSSGMKQRLKYAVALSGTPEFLFLDEPTANLDEQGRRMVMDLIEDWRGRSLLVLATNEESEAALARQRCQLG